MLIAGNINKSTNSNTNVLNFFIITSIKILFDVCCVFAFYIIGFAVGVFMKQKRIIYAFLLKDKFLALSIVLITINSSILLFYYNFYLMHCCNLVCFILCYI